MDGGPGRLSWESSSIEFLDEMAAMGVHIMLSLLNGTACTAEMDQLFEKFKPVCSKSALWITVTKMHARYEARKAAGLKTTGLDNKDNSSANGDIDDDDKDASKKKLKKKAKKGQSQSACNVSFLNFDLDWPDNLIEDCSFLFHFSKESIIELHIEVGFMPMTGQVAKDLKSLGRGVHLLMKQLEWSC